MITCCVCHELEVEDEESACIFCYFSGAYMRQVLSSDERSNILPRLAALDAVLRVETWHVSEGAFCLMIRLEDGRMVTAGSIVEQVIAVGPIQGEVKGLAPCIPELGDPWGIAVWKAGEPEAGMTLMDGKFTDEQIVPTIEQLVAFGPSESESE